MNLDNSQKKYNSKLYRFFDMLYKLLVVNIMTIIISLPIVTLFPSIVAATKTLKDNMNEGSIFKCYFKNFGKYFLKSFKMGLVIILIYGVGLYGYFFWSFLIDFEKNPSMEIVAQIGIPVIVISLIVFTFMIVHIPLLMITFEKLTNGEIFKTSLFVAIRYFITTLLMLFTVALVVGILLFSMVVPGILAVWMIIGISLPMFIAIRVTTPIYYRFAKIDFKKINEKVERDLEDE